MIGAQNSKITTSPEFAPSEYRPNGRLRIELESVRDGLASYQKHNHVLLRNGNGFDNGEWIGE